MCADPRYERATTRVGKEAAEAIKKYVLDSDSSFWGDALYLHTVLAPFWSILVELQRDTATLAHAFFQLRMLGKHVASVTAAGKDWSSLVQHAACYSSGPMNCRAELEDEMFKTLQGHYNKRMSTADGETSMFSGALPAAALLHPACVPPAAQGTALQDVFFASPLPPCAAVQAVRAGGEDGSERPQHGRGVDRCGRAAPAR